MINRWIAAALLALAGMTGCAPHTAVTVWVSEAVALPTESALTSQIPLSQIPLSQIPSSQIPPTAVRLTPLDPAGSAFAPGHTYYLEIALPDLQHAQVTIPAQSETASPGAFALDIPDPDLFLVGAVAQPDAESVQEEWGATYLAYALMIQTANWSPSYHAVHGLLNLSQDAHILALYLCSAYGGRGQWCAEHHLWLFDLLTGDVRPVDFTEAGLVIADDLRFSEDSRALIAEGCLNYANAYFGYCGDRGAAAWDVATLSLSRSSLVATRSRP